MLHVQFEIFLLPAGEVEFAGPGFMLVPVTEEVAQKLPSGHFLQESPGESE